MSTRKFIIGLDGNPQEEPDLMKWAEWMERPERIVKRERIEDCDVSTVFLGLDHQYGDGPPILWETMVFGGKLDMAQDRCSGLRYNAESMHQRMVDKVKSAYGNK